MKPAKAGRVEREQQNYLRQLLAGGALGGTVGIVTAFRRRACCRDRRRRRAGGRCRHQGTRRQRAPSTLLAPHLPATPTSVEAANDTGSKHSHARRRTKENTANPPQYRHQLEHQMAEKISSNPPSTYSDIATHVHAHTCIQTRTSYQQSHERHTAPLTSSGNRMPPSVSTSTLCHSAAV